MVKPTLLDRAAGDARVIVGMGPLQLPSRDELAADVVRLAALSTGNRLGLRRGPASDRRRWRYEPDRLDESVRCWSEDFPGTDHLDLVDKLILLRRRTPTPDGVRLYLAGDHLITDLSHAVFGGGLVVRLWVYLSQCASRPTPDWAMAPAERPHLLWALTRHLLRRPRSVPELIAEAHNKIPAATGSDIAAAAGPPEPSTVTAYLGVGELAALQEWRRANAPGCSVAVLLMAALTRAFVAAGFDLDPVAHVVVDVGRYDRSLAEHLGNVAVGLNLPFAAPHDPAALQHELSSAMTSGRPLAAMLAISAGEWAAEMRRRLGGPDGRGDEPVAIGAGTTLSFSHLLGLDAMPDGGWLGGFDAHEFAAISDPVGSRGIALLTPKMRDRHDISASFDARYHHPDAVARALELATGDPVAILDAREVLDLGEAP
ncbi:hypothetical protein GIY30_01690 [Gordonia sp. HNM0687]|uniref:Condensation domain-containing protein n=1 Tax=Gordonia mangrovi TaxID=2665643 RepID=A0A6L7GLF5_9ACTN|nr:hypothetical protein [Gordonia mangrovi]MXP20081.1 hypothetical protein [Gordonia mangrovi]UVF79308.1 hypothetical protein NWF22_05560 [Gordonia mangrovi]